MDKNVTQSGEGDVASLDTVQALGQRLETLAELAPDDFFKKTIVGGARVLCDANNPLRLNLFSAAIRMMFEHVMGPLAPTSEVEACAWYAPIKDQTKPVRAQRIQYWLQGGLTDDYLCGEFGLEPDQLRKRLLEAFNGLSKHVHGRADTLIYEPDKQEAEAEATVAAVEELIRIYYECREALIEPLVVSLDNDAIDSLLSKTILEVDELASHHTVDEIYTNSTVVQSIGSTSVRYCVSGTVGVTLQWGSSSDRRRGDGAELKQSFEFERLLDVPIDDPRDLSQAEISSGIDTSSWYGNERHDEHSDVEDIEIAYEELEINFDDTRVDDEDY